MTDRAVLVGGVSIIAAALLYRASLSASNESVVQDSPSHASPSSITPESGQYPDEIKHEIHSRVKTFFNEEGFSKLQESFIIVRKFVVTITIVTVYNSNLCGIS